MAASSRGKDTVRASRADGAIGQTCTVVFAKLAKYLGGCWGKQSASNKAQLHLDNSDQDGSVSNVERETRKNSARVASPLALFRVLDFAIIIFTTSVIR